ncbi:alpha-amylase family glycosyl hydrolase [Algibacillus agarilyticus]|uniref:alpha-amylase family glycosyl hydrolase n=1 Tax=Algibacillus agarilyticus TaxID=2234133 RepID=UPI000DD0946C|nr:alpha-amylase family glycosyl hydrolase [Algibacillus agarilyticus]
MNKTNIIVVALTIGTLSSCVVTPTDAPNNIYGTLEPFAKEAVYFALTDRFVDGDKSNNYPEQGLDWGNGEWGSYNRVLVGPNNQQANVGYVGGDFQGVINNLDYIKDLGFTAIWLTPIWDNPNMAFNGGETITYDGGYKDGGKTGYHGYWAHNFYQADEHLVSDSLSFKKFSQTLKQNNLKFVLDIVANHGSPAYTMEVDQPLFGEIYNKAGELVADHKNLHPTKLDKNDPLQNFYNSHTGLAQLSDINENNEAAFDYLTDAYLYWIEQGVDALRIDTIREMPHAFWARVADKVRSKNPGMFMFGESYSYDANFIAQHTYAKNGGVSVLDFPGRESITTIFENSDSHYRDIQSYLHLTDNLYANPYELMTFYDNHDMPRMNADDNGFIDANNWLFTSRGIPVIYYGSEINFMTGKAEHQGNRNYLGQEKINTAPQNPIHQNLKAIANIRKTHIALQQGVQVNLQFTQHTAAFYRIFQHNGVNQTALVLLNKSDALKSIELSTLVNKGEWKNVSDFSTLNIEHHDDPTTVEVKPHGVAVFILNEKITHPDLLSIVLKNQAI